MSMPIEEILRPLYVVFDDVSVTANLDQWWLARIDAYMADDLVLGTCRYVSIKEGDTLEEAVRAAVDTLLTEASDRPEGTANN